MKTITFTNEEIEMIREDIESSREYCDLALTDECNTYATSSGREEDINMVRVAESILKKLKD